MPQWAGSCWYYLRFIDPTNSGALIDPEKEKYWMPVDLYVGGAEHAVLHLLYARFWHKVSWCALQCSWQAASGIRAEGHIVDCILFSCLHQVVGLKQGGSFQDT